MMQVKNLVAWAGPEFAIAMGEIIDLPDATATDRIADGLCEAIDTPDESPGEVENATDTVATRERKTRVKGD